VFSNSFARICSCGHERHILHDVDLVSHDLPEGHGKCSMITVSQRRFDTRAVWGLFGSIYFGSLAGCQFLDSEQAQLSGVTTSADPAITLTTNLDKINGTLGSDRSVTLFGKCRPAGGEILLEFENRDTLSSLSSPQPVFCQDDHTWMMAGIEIPSGRIKTTLSIRNPSSGVSAAIERYLVWGLVGSSVSYDSDSDSILYYQIPMTNQVGGVAVAKYQYAVGCAPQGTQITNWTDVPSGQNQVSIQKNSLTGCSSYYVSFKALDSNNQTLLEFFVNPVTGFDENGFPLVDSGSGSGGSTTVASSGSTGGSSGSTSGGSGSSTSGGSGSSTSGSTSGSFGNINLSTNGTVQTLAESSTAVYLGGSFTAVHPKSAYRFAVVNSSTLALNTSLQSLLQGFDGSIRSLVVDDTNGHLYVGGRFTTYKGQAAQGLARISLADGNLDTAFTTSSGFTGAFSGGTTEVRVIHIEGQFVFVGGDFTSYRGVSAGYFAKLNRADGTRVSLTGLSSSFNGPVNAIASDASTWLYVGGEFQTYNGFGTYLGTSYAKYLAKIRIDTGAPDTASVGYNKHGTSTPVYRWEKYGGFNAPVNALAFHSGKIIIGGSFTHACEPGYGCYGLTNLAEMNDVGGWTSTFGSSSGTNGATAAVTSMCKIGSDLFIGGSFTAVKGNTNSTRITKFNLGSATVDTTFASQTSISSGVVQSLLCSSSENAVYASGTFTSYRGVLAPGFIKVNSSSGDLDASITGNTSAFNGTAYAFAMALSSSGNTSGSLFMGGNFDAYGGYPAKNIAKIIKATGLPDSNFNSSSGFDNTVFSIALADGDSRLIAGGSFLNYRGTGRNRIAKISTSTGSLDTIFNPSGGASDIVRVVRVEPNEIYAYVGGLFATFGGVSRPRLARINISDGAVDTSFAVGTGFGRVDNSGMAVFSLLPDGVSHVYVGGNFDSYNGVTAPRLVRLSTLDGSRDTDFTASGSHSSTASVFSLAMGSDGLWVGGLFSNFRGQVANNLIKLNAVTGVPLNTFTQPSIGGTVNTILVSESDMWLAVTSSNVVMRRLESTGATNSDFSTGTFAMDYGNGAVTPVGRVLLKGSQHLAVAGDFNVLNSQPLSNAVVLNPSTGARVP